MGDHEGNLRSKLAEINATFGISDQWNMSVDMMLGNRSMDYYRVENIHHRDEHKLGLGDTRVTLRYLFENTTFDVFKLQNVTLLIRAYEFLALALGLGPMGPGP